MPRHCGWVWDKPPQLQEQVGQCACESLSPKLDSYSTLGYWLSVMLGSLAEGQHMAVGWAALLSHPRASSSSVALSTGSPWA